MEKINQFEKATTSIKVANMPKVATAFKMAMLNYQYASNCPWYDALVNCDPLKAFSIFNITFDVDRVKQVFIPIIKDIEMQACFKDALKAIAPYMEDGSIFANDTYRYYTITFTDGNISGKVRKVSESTPSNEVVAPKAEVKKETKKEVTKKTTKKAKKEVKKDFSFTPTSVTPVTMKRDDNTYTVQELVRELLKQMDMGNGDKYVTINADFLFQNEKYA